jgi:integrase
LSPTRVRDYLQRTAPQFARVTRKNLVITLRSFLRFAFSAGHLERDVATTIERVPCFSLDRLPRGPKWEDLPKLLATVDRGTKSGRRDFAILLTLMTYGVRAGQLTSLRIDDIHWRDNQIIFQPAKRGRQIIAPFDRGGRQCTLGVHSRGPSCFSATPSLSLFHCALSASGG